MKTTSFRRAGILLLAFALSACSGAKSGELDTDGKIVRSVLGLLASDGKPLCVERITYGSPLVQYRVARRGRLERYYALEWYPPTPFRPPAMPTQQELRDDVAAGRRADIPEPPVRRDMLPRDQRSLIDGQAFALSEAAVATHVALIKDEWAPKNVHARWWPGKDASVGCTAQFVLSGVKRSDHIAFVAVRVYHWGTLYALQPDDKGNWNVTAQWGSWMY